MVNKHVKHACNSDNTWNFDCCIVKTVINVRCLSFLVFNKKIALDQITL